MYLVHVFLLLRYEPKYKRLTLTLEHIAVNIGLTVISLLGYFFIGIAAIQAIFDDKYSIMFYPLVNYLVSVFIVMFMMAQLFATGELSKSLRIICSNYFAQFYGVMCYSFYIWSTAFIFRDGLDNKVWSLFFMVTAFSAFSYRFIEFGQEPSWRKLFYDFPK